ncbi:hypothetical protein A2230_00435 [candidate division WOR-1 bacterium RIFOXYA2_FULL_36_21]|uniref:Uncharacterized protein n=1 Tax=candidate division WOR-1 bacterium RIFOXYB2_FULL_36_35 TaxID=1802578 RepID=A0A1F4S5C0_UNCSA|nr:MAG: hypothetical protein A2230_00435 [candidate division WOR-1 bacterium RIFOXYA2_FULL_36_21]OGC15635.1 MAG: hypothetical protein A2290_06135 [candidate division WOR-1 bacterium RIFOXYB2_FULL_36_35]OGC16383.1 MAG: hypothetical protein A2282_00480 [candidate division WOR-1 bacterium RIFOXYA12_FULL_36_13]
MKLSSIIKKGFNFINILGLKKHKVDDNLFFLGDRNLISSFKKIVLYFPDYEYMHFGDHLFFEPLVRFLKEKGFNLKVIPTSKMEFYFISAGALIGTSEDIKNADLLITRLEFFPAVKRLKNNILFIDTTSLEIKKHLCQDIVDKVAKFLSLNADGFYAKPSKLAECVGNIKLDDSYKYILFNNYIDSGFHRVTKRHYDKLAIFCKKFAEEKNLKVIHVGTQRDKEKDINKYDFVFLDLRGKTTPQDLFYLLSQKSVKYGVSFDSFIMHLFFIYDKKVFVLFRGRFIKKAKDYILKYVNPPFDPKKSLFDVIEYI